MYFRRNFERHMEVYEIEETVYLLLFITDDILLKQ